MLGESVFLGLIAATIKNKNMRFLKYVRVNLFWLPITAFFLEFICGIVVHRNLFGMRGFVNNYYLVVQIIIYTILVIFCYYNLDQKVFAVILAGILMNFTVIAFNDGMMPVDVSGALSRGYGLEVEQLAEGSVAGHGILDENATRIAWLGDSIHIPPPYPHPKTISLGDILISAGVFSLLYNAKNRRDISVR